MKEAIIHYIWKQQKFDKILSCVSGKRISVIQPGNYNTNSGPDFENAKIKIGEIEWSGSVEVHIKSSDWKKHHHHINLAYDQVILHVVWENDEEISRSDDSIIPTLELKDYVSAELIENCKSLISTTEEIPCSSSLNSVRQITILSTIEKAAISRLERKVKEVVLPLLKQNQMNWEETAYQLLSMNFGFKTNNDAFLQLAKNVPLRIIQKHQDTNQIEALLYGQAGFLEGNKDKYALILKKEYEFLSHKYQLASTQLSAHSWKFMRLRPANFPTTRIAELSSLLGNRKLLFSQMINQHEIKSMEKFLATEMSAYWQLYFDFGKKRVKKQVQIGKGSVQNLILNTVAPLLVAYALHYKSHSDVERAAKLLESLPPENNKIIREWKNMGIRCDHALDSQGLIELKNEYCLKRKCLECSIGTFIVKRKMM